MIEQPTFENGGVCPHCHFPVPPGSSDYCTSCGRAFYGGASSGNINLKSAEEFISGLSYKLNMSVQRMALAVASILGLLACLTPWYSAVGRVGFKVTANAFRVTGLGIPYTNSTPNFFGTLVFIAFAAALTISFLGNKANPIGKRRYLIVVGGGISLLSAIINSVMLNNLSTNTLITQLGSGSIRFGLYLALLMTIAVGVIPFVKHLEQ